MFQVAECLLPVWEVVQMIERIDGGPRRKFFLQVVECNVGDQCCRDPEIDFDRLQCMHTFLLFTQIPQCMQCEEIFRPGVLIQVKRQFLQFLGCSISVRIFECDRSLGGCAGFKDRNGRDRPGISVILDFQLLKQTIVSIGGSIQRNRLRIKDQVYISVQGCHAVIHQIFQTAF